MKTLRQYSAVVLIGVAFWLLAISSFATMAAQSITSPFVGSTQDSINNGTIPPVEPFTKTVRFTTPGANHAYSGELVIYTIELRHIITDSYAGTIGVTDTLPAELTVDPDSIDTSEGVARLADGGVITWTLDVETGGAYSLTYTGRAPAVMAETILTNTAVLYEIKNEHHPITPTTKTLTATLTVKVRPWDLHLPIIAKQPTPTPTSTPTPTPTPVPLPAFVNPGFESGPQQGWSESPIRLIYSTTEIPLAGTQGQYYAWLGGTNNQTNELSQAIALPARYNDIRIRYRYWIYSEEGNNCGNDIVEVRINAAPQAIETEGGVQQPQQLCQTGRTYGWKSARTGNLAAYGGSTITLSFRTQLNSSRNSNFFVDVVELCSDDPGSTRNCSLASSAVAAATPVPGSSAVATIGVAHGEAATKP